MTDSASGKVKSPKGEVVDVELKMHTVLNASGDPSKFVVVASMDGQKQAIEFTDEKKAKEMLDKQKSFFVK
jgi:hypothetical protein